MCTAVPMNPALVIAVMAVAFCAVDVIVGHLRILGQEPRSRWLGFASLVVLGDLILDHLPEFGSHAATFEDIIDLPPALSESLSILTRWVV